MTHKEEKDCKHDEGFRLIQTGYRGYSRIHKEYNWAWYCNHGCGFSLNFDPVKFPWGIAVSKRKEEKTVPTLTSSKY